MDFFQLVKYIQTQRPIYGMQAKGTDGVDEPFDRIEDLAQFYLDAIRKLQPHGPYFLIGYSLGGLVMLEMAQRLIKTGENVALLAMLESYPHPRFLSLKAARAPGRSSSYPSRDHSRTFARAGCAFIHHSSFGTPIVCFSRWKRERADSNTGWCIPYPGNATGSRECLPFADALSPSFLPGRNKIRQG